MCLHHIVAQGVSVRIFTQSTVHNTVTHLCTVDSRTHVVQPRRLFCIVLQVRVGRFRSSSAVRPFVHDIFYVGADVVAYTSCFFSGVVFTGAIKKLPAELKQVLEDSGHLVLGLLRFFPWTSWGVEHGAAAGCGTIVGFVFLFDYLSGFVPIFSFDKMLKTLLGDGTTAHHSVRLVRAMVLDVV